MSFRFSRALFLWVSDFNWGISDINWGPQLGAMHKSPTLVGVGSWGQNSKKIKCGRSIYDLPHCLEMTFFTLKYERWKWIVFIFLRMCMFFKIVKFIV